MQMATSEYRAEGIDLLMPRIRHGVQHIYERYCDEISEGGVCCIRDRL